MLSPRHLFLLAASSLVACTASEQAPNDPTQDISVQKSTAERNTTPSLSDAELGTFAADQAAFAVDLYQAVRKDPEVANKDIFLSPHSVSIALAMTYAGANGATKDEMKKALHFSLADDRLHTAFDYLDLALESRGKNAKGKDDQPFRLRVANSLWGQKGFAFETPFLDKLAINYGAGLNGVDFAGSPVAAARSINAWVEKQTEDRIKDLVPKEGLPGSTRLVLVNAIYFNAAWQSKFEPSLTKNEPFTKLDGSTVEVAMMNAQAQRPYNEGDGFQATQLPYEGNEMSLVVIAPTTGTFASFEASLTGDKVLDILAGMKTRPVRLGLPKVKLDGDFKLKPAFKALGMNAPFADTADFSDMTKADALHIEEILHKTFLELDENGTEAAAATAVVNAGTSANPDAPAVMKVDRPYLMAIVDNQTKTLAFLGRILEPKAK